jgi:hypothetical protein
MLSLIRLQPLMAARHASDGMAAARTHWRAACAALVLCLWAAAWSRAADPRRASSGLAARKEAIASMPLDRLDAPSREKVLDVLKKTSVYRRMPTAVTRSDPELYLFVLNHPEILANIWQLMQIENIVLQSTGPNTYFADDGDGTKGEVEFLYRGADVCLVYAKGSYEGPLFTQPITGTAVLLLRSGYSRAADGGYQVTTTLDAFVHLDNVGLDFLAKTFQPLVCRVADYNFLVTAQFFEALSRTAEVNQMGMQRLCANLQNLDPGVRTQFAMLAADVAQRAGNRTDLNAEARVPLAKRQASPRAIVTE